MTTIQSADSGESATSSDLNTMSMNCVNKFMAIIYLMFNIQKLGAEFWTNEASLRARLLNRIQVKIYIYIFLQMFCFPQRNFASFAKNLCVCSQILCARSQNLCVSLRNFASACKEIKRFAGECKVSQRT